MPRPPSPRDLRSAAHACPGGGVALLALPPASLHLIPSVELCQISHLTHPPRRLLIAALCPLAHPTPVDTASWRTSHQVCGLIEAAIGQTPPSTARKPTQRFSTWWPLFRDPRVFRRTLPYTPTRDSPSPNLLPPTPRHSAPRPTVPHPLVALSAPRPVPACRSRAASAPPSSRPVGTQRAPTAPHPPPTPLLFAFAGATLSLSGLPTLGHLRITAGLSRANQQLCARFLIGRAP